MNNYIQNKQDILKELESLLSGKQITTIKEENEMFVYCNFMKKFFLSCSTNN